MNFDDALQALTQKFGSSAILGKEDTKPDPSIKVAKDSLHSIVSFLRNEMNFETLSCISGVDYPGIPAFAVVYHFFSYSQKLMLAIKVSLPRQDEQTLPTISDLFKAANWLERETFDMIGIRFTGHPDHRRILCPEDWKGFPLRKDYETPDYYNGMPVPLYFEDPKAATKGGGHA